MDKKIPMRRCVGCGESFPKKSLVRVVRTPEGEITLDDTGKLNGRGAYVCRSSECFKTARKKRRFASNLGSGIPEELLDSLEERIKAWEKEGSASV